MIASLLQFGIFAAIIAVVSWVAVCIWHGEPYFALLGLCGFLFAHALVLAAEFVWMVRRSRGAVAGRVPVADLLHAWRAECWCAIRVFCWRLPFRSSAWPDHLKNARGRRGLLLVHGFLCNRGVWNGWYPRLLRSDVPFIGLSLEPLFGSIDSYLEQIERAVGTLTDATGMPPVIVAHSMGGLAVRAWLRHGGCCAVDRVHAVVTLATPHHGTALVTAPLGANVRQMAIDSSWLEQLRHEEPAGVAARFICAFSRCDNVVFPAERARMDGAEVIEVSRCAHIQMVDHLAAYRAVCRLLEQDNNSS